MLFLVHFCGKDIISKNPALSCTTPSGPLNTMLSLKKTNEPIPGKNSE